MKPITIWQRWDNAAQTYAYSHTEVGHSHRDTPKAVTRQEENEWASVDVWNRSHGFIDDDRTATIHWGGI